MNATEKPGGVPRVIERITSVALVAAGTNRGEIAAIDPDATFIGASHPDVPDTRRKGALIAADPDIWRSVIAYAASPARQKRATAKMVRTRDSVAYFAVLVGALCALSGCAAVGGGSDDAADGPDGATKNVDCLVNSGSVTSSKLNDPCAEFAEDASFEEQPCDEVWQLGFRFPAPYYGCATDDGHEVFDLGVECDDPFLDGYWLYNDMMARQGGPVVASKVALLESGHPAC